MSVEIPYNYYLFTRAREMGVKSVLVYNWEFLDYLNHPEWPKPDLLIAPSMWHFGDAMKVADTLGIALRHLPVPVNRTYFPFRRHRQAKKFLHIAGHQTAEDRNGTQLVLAALPLIKSDIQLTIRTQHYLGDIPGDFRLKIEQSDQKNYWEVFRNEDVLLLPRRYGGLSLQLNEALSSGMPVIMTNIEPQNYILPAEWLVDAELYTHLQTRTLLDVYRCTPEALAAKIDYVYGQTEEIIAEWSAEADRIAESISWEKCKEHWKEALWLLLSK